MDTGNIKTTRTGSQGAPPQGTGQGQEAGARIDLSMETGRSVRDTASSASSEAGSRHRDWEKAEREERERYAPVTKRLLKEVLGPLREAAKAPRKAVGTAGKEVDRLTGIIEAHRAKAVELEAQAEALEAEMLEAAAAGSPPVDEERLSELRRQLAAQHKIITGLSDGHLARARAALEKARQDCRSEAAQVMNGLTEHKYQQFKAAYLGMLEEATAWLYVVDAVCDEFGLSRREDGVEDISLPLEEISDEWV